MEPHPPPSGPTLATVRAEEFEIAAVRAFPDGGAAALEATRHGDVRGRGRARVHLIPGAHTRAIVDLLGTPQARYDLPPPLHARHDHVLISAFHPQRGTLAYWLYGFDGQRIRSGTIAGAADVLAYSEGPRCVWIHTESEHLQIAEPSTAAPLGILRRIPRARGTTPETRLHVLDGRLAALPVIVPRQRAGKTERVTTGRMTWVDLDGDRPDEESAWPEQTIRVTGAAGALWASGPQGLWRLAPGEPLRRLAVGACWAASAEGPLAWIGTRPTPDVCQVAELEWSTGKERWRARVPEVPYELHRVGRGLVVAGFRWFALLGEKGELQARSDSRRETGFARLRDGSAAVSAGRDCAVLSPDGGLRRRIELPYDGRILGATADHFVFGPPPGGGLRPEPDSLLAIDGNGAITARAPLTGASAARLPVQPPPGGGPAEDLRGFGHDGVLLVSAEGGSCRRWSPSAAPAAKA